MELGVDRVVACRVALGHFEATSSTRRSCSTRRKRVGGFDVVGKNLERPLEPFDGLGVTIQLLQDPADVSDGFVESRIELDGLLRRGDRFVEFARPHVAPRQACCAPRGDSAPSRQAFRRLEQSLRHVSPPRKRGAELAWPSANWIFLDELFEGRHRAIDIVRAR